MLGFQECIHSDLDLKVAILSKQIWHKLNEHLKSFLLGQFLQLNKTYDIMENTFSLNNKNTHFDSLIGSDSLQNLAQWRFWEVWEDLQHLQVCTVAVCSQVTWSKLGHPPSDLCLINWTIVYEDSSLQGNKNINIIDSDTREAKRLRERHVFTEFT